MMRIEGTGRDEPRCGIDVEEVDKEDEKACECALMEHEKENKSERRREEKSRVEYKRVE